MYLKNLLSSFLTNSYSTYSTLSLLCLQYSLVAKEKITNLTNGSNSINTTNTLNNPSTILANDDYLPPELIDEMKQAAEVGGDSRFLQEFLKMLGSLGLLIGCLLIFLWILKKLMATREIRYNQTSQIKVLETRTLSHKTTIHVIDVFGKAFAVTESTNGITLLGDLESTEDGINS